MTTVSAAVKQTMTKVATAEVLRFMTDCLKAAGVSAKAAHQQAEMLLEADRCGHPSHGLNKLEMYVKDIQLGLYALKNQPLVVMESISTAVVDGRNALGATISHFATDVAILKARRSGIGWVTVRGANHNGILGFWANKIANHGYLGMAFSNTSPVLAPTRSRKPALGTNPLALVAPGSGGETFYLDMATTTVALGKIDMHRQMGEPLPKGWALGPDGEETVDAELAFQTSALTPLGGKENTSGYKGFGLAALVDILCGISSGANYGPLVRSWNKVKAGDRPANLGQCFVAINLQSLAPGFGDRLAKSMRYWRQLEPVDPNLPVLAPGDKEIKAAYESYKTGTLTYMKQTIETNEALAKRLNVTPMKVCLDE